jgi:hypothetical protein
MRLAKPTPIRLTPELLRWLDRWRGDRMSRATAIRILLEQAINPCGLLQELIEA